LCCERNRQNVHRPHAHVKFAASGNSSDDGQAPPSSRNSNAMGKSFMENVLPEAITGAASFAGQSFDQAQADAEKEQRKNLKEIKSIAKRLEGPVQKYPRSGKGLFKKMQDRYVACIPGEGTAGDDEIALWKSGTLAYWECPASFKQSAAPKGFVTLLRIAKVWVSKDDARGRSVIVKHKRGDEMQELVLCLPTKREAEEWSYALWEFISKLRGQSNVSIGSTYCD